MARSKPRNKTNNKAGGSTNTTPKIQRASTAASAKTNAGAKPSYQNRTKRTEQLLRPLDASLEIYNTMHTLLASRSASSTICQSEIPRRLHAEHPSRYPDWRGMMDPVRDIVWDAVERGEVEVTQGGGVRTLEQRNEIKGPIRIRRGPEWPITAPS